MNTVEILKKAKERIGAPDRWYQGGYGPRSMRPADLALGSESPCCAIGALCYAARSASTMQGPVARAVAVLEGANGFDDIADFNDNPNTTHADIMDLFDRAIAAEETTP